MAILEQIRKKRAEYLERLYGVVGGSTLYVADGYAVAADMDLGKNEATGFMEYFASDGLIEWDDTGPGPPKAGHLRLTLRALKAVENAGVLAPRQHGPQQVQTNIINVQHLHNSQIQQGTHGSHQIMGRRPTTPAGEIVFGLVCEPWVRINADNSCEYEIRLNVASTYTRKVILRVEAIQFVAEESQPPQTATVVMQDTGRLMRLRGEAMLQMPLDAGLSETDVKIHGFTPSQLDSPPIDLAAACEWLVVRLHVSPTHHAEYWIPMKAVEIRAQCRRRRLRSLEEMAEQSRTANDPG